MLRRVKPQVLAAILTIGGLAALVTMLVPDQVDKIVGGAITGVGMLGMKILEKE
tara:strand:- start:1042 stop:1203 length:162 start_codon:yes stop_codon:yes gene_type:complete